MEGALGLAHRLPVGASSGAAAPSQEAESAAGEARNLLSALLDLQHNLAQQRGVGTASFDEALHGPVKKQEAGSWALVDAQLQPLIDWGLGVADEWKERTRLDTRRSFKVLDQSLSSQMRAAEAEPEKVRRRCTPPPGRHKVFGASSPPAASSTAEDDGATRASEHE